MNATDMWLIGSDVTANICHRPAVPVVRASCDPAGRTSRRAGTAGMMRLQDGMHLVLDQGRYSVFRIGQSDLR
jgi:hypothetical protein